MKVLVVGASSGTGLSAVRTLVARGHEVTAMARREMLALPEGATARRGDVLVPEEVDAAVAGHDAVVVTLGIAESPLLVRLGFGKTPIDVRSRGTTNVVAAMRRHGVRRLVVQTSYGVGVSRDRLPFVWRMIFALLLRPQIDDTERQETIVRESGLDWTLVQPVGLVDAPTARPTFTSLAAQTRSMSVSRAGVASVLSESLGNHAVLGACLAVSS